MKTNETYTATASAAQPTEEQFGAFRSMFDHFNRELFGGVLPAVLLNLSRASRKTAAYYKFNSWQREEVTADEISINPIHIHEAAALETAQSLVHEMVHLWQFRFGRPSSNRGF